MQITKVPTLKINKLTQAQYNRELANGNIDENAFYLTPDEGNSAGSYIIPIYRGDDEALHLDPSFTFSDDDLIDAFNNNYFIALKLSVSNNNYKMYTLANSIYEIGEYHFSYVDADTVHTIILYSDGLMEEYEYNIETDAYLKYAHRSADAKAVGDALATKAPLYTYGEEDLVPGETPLETGKLHFVYI